MKTILMKTSYREFYKPGDIVQEDDEKARQLVDRGSAEYVNVEAKAPLNKEINTLGKSGYTCTQCGRIFPKERGLKLHSSKAHK